MEYTIHASALRDSSYGMWEIEINWNPHTIEFTKARMDHDSWVCEEAEWDCVVGIMLLAVEKISDQAAAAKLCAAISAFELENLSFTATAS